MPGFRNRFSGSLGAARQRVWCMGCQSALQRLRYRPLPALAAPEDRLEDLWVAGRLGVEVRLQIEFPL